MMGNDEGEQPNCLHQHKVVCDASFQANTAFLNLSGCFISKAMQVVVW